MESKIQNSESKIQQALVKLFKKHRIVFWYDEEESLRKDFDAIELPEVDKVEIVNNEFGLKYRLLREQPTQKFLLFKSGAQPADRDNWLLDVQLAHTDFRTDKASLWLTELELPYEFRPIVNCHEFFFNSGKRRDQLKDRVTKTDTTTQICIKMLGVCADSDSRIDSVLENLLEELATDSGVKRYELIAKCGLDPFLWEQVKKTYQYASNAPSVKDFAIELFKSCYQMELGGTGKLGNEALVFLKRWKDSRTHEKAFETLSDRFAEILGVQNDLESRELKQLAEVDYFRLIDQRVLSELANKVLGRTLSAGECTQVIRSRRRGHWYREYADLYEAVGYAAELLHMLNSMSLELSSIEQGITAYVGSLYKIDQLYRKFIYHSVRAGQATFFGPLNQQVCKLYTNSFLLPLGDRWQELVDKLERWSLPGQRHQTEFYKSYVGRVLDKNNKVYVIISDAMRFEIGEELCRLIRSEDKFEAKIDHMISVLPSYTQLGMAALLPHLELQLNSDKTPTVNLNGQSSSGTVNRDKILKAANKGSALAIKADEMIAKTKEEVRELVRDHDVIYIYQNVIDKRGHTRDTERKAFEATEEAMEEIVKLVRKLTSANATNVVITADHGFIYQDEVEESDFSSTEISGTETASDRRFVVGNNLQVSGGAKLYQSAELGLKGDLEVAVPKSINRLRKSGASVRFMHGGSTLQEIVIPVIQIKKRRATDLSSVGVDVLPPTTSVISTGQLALVFYQNDPVTDKVQARRLRIGLYGSDAELISDSHELSFDLTSENPRERELKLRLVLSKRADDYNQQQVQLKLEELVAGTTHYQEYKTVSFTLRRSFTSDFD
ncbi:MAG: BREX-1 system phosphatase PglZ type A [Pirellulaceae bacterium]|nr:BREX-1 system phosphatase PglZ type A [Pirellulaceae bacterium]